jgi:2-polyprenyl-3-methyl-5-hydroxy-6-metoxy-1,4-benzoquinol methylase
MQKDRSHSVLISESDSGTRKLEHFQRYEGHYKRVGNEVPDWTRALANPSAYACRQPWLPANKNARILDFGCGWGKQLMSLWCAGFHDLEGVELVPEQARVTMEGVNGKFPVYCMDGRQFVRSRPATYDLVILNDVIEHVPVSESVPLLQGICDALVPGGRIVVRTPNMSSLLAGYSRYMDLTHVTGFTEISIVQVLEQAGFVDHQFVREYFGWPPRTRRPWVAVRRLNFRGLFNEWLHRILYTARGQCPAATIFSMNLVVYADKPKHSEDDGAP